ncbi:MAG: phenylacetate-CoA oxygenase subunit PaaC [Proteobacteria bacterium]|nr:phenylacetate-CoA oxygenase subunit PaaC [Pseudomonadota bacterium]
MNAEQALIAYVLRLADNALILGQRMIEVVAAGPELEEELANANFALDFIGQARMLYTCAGELEGQGRSEDDFAFMRDEREFQNLLLLEQPNGHFGDALVRQFLFESFYVHLLDGLTRCSAPGLAEIAARAIKEVKYHLRHHSQWLIRLGDGTELSHARVQASLDDAWQYTGEMFVADAVDTVVHESFAGPDLEAVAVLWRRDVAAVVEQATLALPGDQAMASGGKDGRHSEHFGFLLAEMQTMQRSFPGATW